MVPSINVNLVALYDTAYDSNGVEYIARYVCCELTWVPLEHVKQGKTKVGQVLNNKIGKTKSPQKKSGGLPSAPACHQSVGDVLVGTDGNEYIVKNCGDENTYVLHQKIHKWSKSGAMYVSVDNNGYSSSKQKSRKSSSKKIQSP
jgi:hypothetical protein